MRGSDPWVLLPRQPPIALVGCRRGLCLNLGRAGPGARQARIVLVWPIHSVSCSLAAATSPRYRGRGTWFLARSLSERTSGDLRAARARHGMPDHPALLL